METSPRLLALLFFSLSIGHTAFTQNPQWSSNLIPGNFAVGFRTSVAAHFGTVYFTDSLGNRIPRSLQIYYWYPAKPGRTRMIYENYFDFAGHDLAGFVKAADLRDYLINEFKRGPLGPSFPGGIKPEEFSQILNTKVPAYYQAEPLAGKFPVVIHYNMHGLLSQSVLLEYLASHGYIVASISALGSAPYQYERGEHNARGYESANGDLGFAIGRLAKEFPGADLSRMAMIGMNAQYGIYYQMKDPLFKAVACLECGFDLEILKRLPFCNFRGYRAPTLTVVSSVRNQNARLQTYLDSLPHAPRWFVKASDIVHSHFYPFPKIAQPNRSDLSSHYDFVASLTKSFLDTYVAERSNGAFDTSSLKNMAHAPADLLLTYLPALDSMPTDAEFLNWLRFGHMGRVRAALARYPLPSLVTQESLFPVVMFLCRDRLPHAWEAFFMYLNTFPGDSRTLPALNLWAYHFLNTEDFEMARKTFTMMTDQFPQSPYAHDGMADYYERTGDKEKALWHTNLAAFFLPTAKLNDSQFSLLQKSIQDRLLRLKK